MTNTADIGEGFRAYRADEIGHSTCAAAMLLSASWRRCTGGTLVARSTL